MRFQLSSLTIFIFLNCLHSPVNAEPQLQVTTTDVSCYGGNDGKIHLFVRDGQPTNFNLVVSDSLNQPIANFESINKDSLVINDLLAGKYYIQFSTAAMTQKQEIKIKSPSKLQLDIIKIIKIMGAGNAVLANLQAIPSGGTPPYTALWSENTGKQSGLIAEKLPPGIYNCVINDSNKCGEVQATFYLFEDEIETFKQQK